MYKAKALIRRLHRLTQINSGAACRARLAEIAEIAEIAAKNFLRFTINPNNPIDRHSGVGRNPVIKTLCEAGKTRILSRLRGRFLIIWIPAYAGMTRHCANKLFRFNPSNLRITRSSPK